MTTFIKESEAQYIKEKKLLDIYTECYMEYRDDLLIALSLIVIKISIFGITVIGKLLFHVKNDTKMLIMDVQTFGLGNTIGMLSKL